MIEFLVLKLSLSDWVHGLNFICATKILLYALPWKENRYSDTSGAGGAFIPFPYVFYFQSLSLPTVWLFVTFLYHHPTINSAVLCLENKWNLQFCWYIYIYIYIYIYQICVFLLHSSSCVIYFRWRLIPSTTYKSVSVAYNNNAKLSAVSCSSDTHSMHQEVFTNMQISQLIK